jgi:two-component system response regulator DesR
VEGAVRQALRLTAGAARTQLESGSGSTAAEPSAATRPDVAVVDFIMPGGGGPEAARQIQDRSPGTRIVGLTADGPDAYLAMLRAGASGLLVKGGSAERLVEMIHRAHERSA